MSFTKLSDYSYTALSTDAKTTAGVNIGARLVEYDTDIHWIFDGTAWREIENVAITYEHKKIHNGEMWDISARYAAVANNANADLVVEHTEQLHCFFSESAAGAVFVDVYEGPTISGGSAGMAKNARRPSGDTGAPTVTVGPTVNTTGDKIFEGYDPGGKGGNAPGGSQTRDSERILDINTKYLFRLTNKKGSAADMAWALLAYEHD